MSESLHARIQSALQQVHSPRHGTDVHTAELTRDIATTNLEFEVVGRDLIGRQSQTLVRFPDVGWKVVAAHVSTMNDKPLWLKG